MDLSPGETVLFEGHPSWRSIVGFYVLGLALGAVAVAVAHFAGAGTALVVLIALAAAAIILVIGLLRRIGTAYRVTNRRLWIRRGILSRAVQETRLDRVQNVNTRQSLFERLLRVGTVDFDTAAGDDYDFSFRGVADPEGITRVVDRALGA